MKLFPILYLGVSVAAFGATHTVKIEGMNYNPETLVVNSGETIVWLNKDFFPHTVTARAFDSKKIGPSASWKFKTGKKGTFSYRCLIHPTMKGKILVR